MGMLVSVLRTRSDCTNGGLSAKYDRIVIVNGEGPFEPDEKTPAFKLVHRNIGGRNVVHAEPVEPAASGNIGWLAGGNFCATSDSRFDEAIGFYGAVSIHDRQETAEMYRQLSV